uniref:Core shell protein Gag P30 domain-containing protein n=1 Tax=Anolis carolinensis TaxID=28377 RepID=A0A803TCF7_ANOCA
MGGKESKRSKGAEGSMTPLQCMLDNFDKFSKYTYEKGMKPNKLRSLCEVEWPSFPLTPQWPPEGSLDLALTANVYRFVGEVHPDQAKYISAWYDIVRKPPDWLTECKCMVVGEVMPGGNRGMVLGDTQKGIGTLMGKKGGRQIAKPPPYQDSGNPADEPMPAPPYIPTLYTPLTSHVRGGAVGGLDLTAAASAPKQEQPAVSSGPQPLYPSEEIKRTERQAKIDARQKLAELKQAHCYSESSDDEATLCPIREVPQLVPLSLDDQGRPRFETRTLFQHVPFTSSDILNWRTNRPAWSEDPRGMANLVEGIIQTHNPSWVDLKQLLEALLTAEERVLLTQVGRQEAAKEHATSRSIDAVDVYQERVFPVREDPHWDLNEPGGPGKDALRLYQNLVVRALRRGVPRVPNLKKIYQMEQEKNESPVAFLERLREAFEKFSPYDMDDQRDQAAGKIVLKSVFSSQCSPDIRRKLQKDAGLAHLTLERILEIANQVYLSREVVQAKKDETAVARRAKGHSCVIPRGTAAKTQRSRLQRERSRKERPGGQATGKE